MLMGVKSRPKVESEGGPWRGGSRVTRVRKGICWHGTAVILEFHAAI